MARGDIRISPKHGVNPSVALCGICGQPKNEIVLMGRLPNDAAAPHQAVYDAEPCDACKESMQKGIMLIEVKDGESGDNPYRTGRIVVVTEDYIQRALEGDLVQYALTKRVIYIEESVAHALGLDAPVPDPKEEA